MLGGVALILPMRILGIIFVLSFQLFQIDETFGREFVLLLNNKIKILFTKEGRLCLFNILLTKKFLSIWDFVHVI